MLAGVNASDSLRRIPTFVRQLQQPGFSGVHNFPTARLFEGVLRANMEATGLGYDREVAMIAACPQEGFFQFTAQDRSSSSGPVQSVKPATVAGEL